VSLPVDDHDDTVHVNRCDHPDVQFHVRELFRNLLPGLGGHTLQFPMAKRQLAVLGADRDKLSGGLGVVVSRHADGRPMVFVGIVFHGRLRRFGVSGW
jgi:hypothetical protein